MAITYPKAFQRSPAAGFDGTFEWDFLKPAFAPTNIEPMDFDGVVERRGQFLCFETKSGNKPIPDGQKYTLETLVNTGPWTVILLRAKCADEIKEWDVWCRGRNSGRLEKVNRQGDADALVEFVRRWFSKANAS